VLIDNDGGNDHLPLASLQRDLVPSRQAPQYLDLCAVGGEINIGAPVAIVR
jgi:hypothetical protein